MASKKEGGKLSPFEARLNEWAQKLSHVPFVQKMMLFHNLAIMIKAGLPLVSALKVLTEQVENLRLKKVVAEVKERVEKGQQLSEGLGAFPKIFPAMYVSMIAAGETGGKLEEALAHVAEQMKKSHELTSRVKGAMVYPAVILLAMIGIGVEMIVFVLPKILVMFEEVDVQLPAATRGLLWTVKFMQQYGILVALGVAAAIAGFIAALKQAPFRKAIDAILLRLPICGRIMKQVNLARFTLTLSSLLSSAIPIVEAVRISGNVQTNLVYREAIFAASESLKKGEALSEILARAPRLFPPLVTEMALVGEQAGQVEHMLKELAEYYGNEVDSTMKNFSTVIEPVIILFMGLMVGGMAVAVIMPMYSLAQGF